MSFLFRNPNEKRWTDPRTREGYVSPFGKDMVEKDMHRRRYEVLARFVKNRTKTDKPLKDIAAELYMADERRKGNL